MILLILICLFVGFIVGVFLMGILAAAKQNTEPEPEFDPYSFRERQQRVDRALAREHIAPLQGHPRLGIDHPPRAS